MVTRSSAVPVMPVEVLQERARGVLPDATMTDGLTFFVEFSRQYHSSSTFRLKAESVPDQLTSSMISLNLPPVQRKGLGGE